MEEENQRSPVREGSAHSGEKPASEPSLDSDWDQSGTLCIGHVIILKALQQAVGSGLAGELKDPASEKDAECKCTSQNKWCWNSRTEGLGGNWLGAGDSALAYDRNGPMNEVFQTPSSGIMPDLAGILNYLDWPYHMPQEVESSIDAQAVYGDEDIEEVELVAEVRLEDIGALSGISRRNLSWRRQKAVTALLFKMEEANLASRAKAQELIQATNQILTHTKPSASLAPPQPPAPPTHPPASHLAVPPISYHLQGSMPLGGCGSTPSTPTGGLAGTLSQASAGPPSAGIFASSSGTDLGSTSSEGRGDSDKYLKKLHTQERAVEEVKLAIKPYYQKKEITKEEYKDILRKAVHKICHSKSGEINPVKVNNLVKAYVQRYKYFRKHGRKMDEEQRPPKEIGGPDKSGLPMPPL